MTGGPGETAGGIAFLWFDLGYTLVYNLREPTYRRVLAELGAEVDPQALELAFHQVDKLFMREYPGTLCRDPVTWMPWYLGLLHHRLGLRLDISRAYARWREIQESTADYWRAFEFSRPVLAGLRRRGYRLGVISNWDPSARALLARQGLAGFFERVVISGEAGCEKPDERIFRLALQGTGLRGGQCLYVGDNYYDDALGSRKVGMASVIINRFGRLGIEEIRGQPILRDLTELEGYLKGRQAVGLLTNGRLTPGGGIGRQAVSAAEAGTGMPEGSAGLRPPGGGDIPQ